MWGARGQPSRPVASGTVTATVHTSAYDGPVDVLLQLVTSHQVDIFDIPLAEVVDAFVADVASPGSSDVEPDEELVGWEERDLLLARLLECQAYSAAADGFALLIEQAARSVPRTAGLDPDLVIHAPDLLEGVTPDQVAAAFMRATAERPAPVVDLHHVTVDAVTVADAVAELALRLPRSGPSTFRELTGHLTSRIEIIVRFLALLELCKQGRVSLDQGHSFGDLAVEWVPESPDTVPVGFGPTDEYEG
jgi:segregation and condensation protein A